MEGGLTQEIPGEGRMMPSQAADHQPHQARAAASNGGDGRVVAKEDDAKQERIRFGIGQGDGKPNRRARSGRGASNRWSSSSPAVWP